MLSKTQTDEEAKAIEWLQNLHKDIWEDGVCHVARHKPPQKWSKEARQLTEEEVNQIWECAEDFDLPVVIGSAEMGFGFGFYIYETPQAPGLDAECVSLFYYVIIIPLATLWPEMLSRKAKNKQMLVLYGLPLPKGREHYEY